MHAIALALALAALSETSTSTPAASAPGEPKTSGPTTDAPTERAFLNRIDFRLQAGGYPDGNPDGLILVPRMSAFVVLRDHLALSGHVGSIVTSAFGGEYTPLPANLFFAAHYIRKLGQSHRVRIGFGVGIPMYPSSSGPGIGLGLVGSTPTGLWDAWMFMPATTFVMPIRWEYRGTHMGAAADLAFATYFVVSEDSPDFGIQLAPEAFAILPWVDIGLRFQLASIPTIDTELTQLALNPFLRGSYGIFRTTVGFYYMLDEPFGPTFTDGTAFGIEVMFGLAF